MGKNAKTVLVVDDEPDVVTYLSTLLEEAGWTTVVATNGDEATARVQEHPPDLITLDITMPEKSGVKFYREMKENPDYRRIPIIIVTGVSSEFEKFISTRRQVPPPEGYLSKPFDRDELLALVHKLTTQQHV